MKKILIMAINARFTHSNPSLYYLKRFTEDLDYDIEVREFNINNTLSDIIDDVTSVNPMALALSVYIWNSEMVRNILADIKKHLPKSVIILGGPEVSYNPGEWLSAFSSIDFIITGYGEAGFRYLLQRNLSADERVIAKQNPSFKEIPFPYRDNDLDCLRNKYIYYESSRGCPYSCTYCLSSRGDQKMEFREPHQVFDELRQILRHRPKVVKFVDRTFNIRGAPHREIWKFIIKTFGNSGTQFHFEITPGLLEESDFSILKSAPPGLFRFEVGIQTTNPDTLREVKRTGHWQSLKPRIARLIEMGTIHIHLDLIAGLPLETMDTFVSSVNEIYDLHPHHLQLGFLKILPGTEMSQRYLQYNIKFDRSPPYQVRETRWMPADDLLLLERIANLIDRLHNSGRFVLTMENLEKEYPKPFDAFRAMAELMKLGAIPLLTRKFEDGARLILDFCRQAPALSESFFTDCLRWDWCACSHSHRYPHSLKPGSYREIKKTGLRFFESYASGAQIHYGDAIFPQDHLQRSIFFQPESADFTLSYMPGASMAMFLPDKRNIIFIFKPDTPSISSVQNR